MPTFDIVSRANLTEVENAIQGVRREVKQRYDFKGAKALIDFSAEDSRLVLSADDDFKLNALRDIVQTRLVRRKVPVKNLKYEPAEQAAGGTVRQEIALQQGIPNDTARAIVKFLKEAKLKKVQTTIQGDQLRVSSPSRDDLQTAIGRLREHDFGIELQFGNYRG